MNKPFLKVLFLGIAFLPFLSCSQNKMKLDEQSLKDQIMQSEIEQAYINSTIEKPDEAACSSHHIAYFEEDRSVDNKRPPIIIDIAGNLRNSKKLSLSDVASEVIYIRLDPLPDPSMECKMKYRYLLLKDYIVAVDFNGIHLFNQEGKYYQTIVKNEYSAVEIRDESIIVSFDMEFKGGGTTVWTNENKLYYPYINMVTGQHFIMEYDYLKPDPSDKINREGQSKKIIGSGDVFFDVNSIKNEPRPKKIVRGMWSADHDYFFKNISEFSTNQDYLILELEGNHLFGIYSKDGKALARFSFLEQSELEGKSEFRGIGGYIKYQKQGYLFFKSAYNDTVFSVRPPNRLNPEFVFKLDDYKVSIQQGMDVDFDLNGKIIPIDWAETDHHAFLTFSKNNINSPFARKNKNVEIYHAVFFKNNKNLFIVDGDPKDYSPNILENDLDGGMPVWPKSYMVGNDGEMLISLKGAELKRHIQSESFIDSAAPIDRKNKLQKFVQSLTNADDVLMIIK